MHTIAADGAVCSGWLPSPPPKSTTRPANKAVAKTNTRRVRASRIASSAVRTRTWSVKLYLLRLFRDLAPLPPLPMMPAMRMMMMTTRRRWECVWVQPPLFLSPTSSRTHLHLRTPLGGLPEDTAHSPVRCPTPAVAQRFAETLKQVYAPHGDPPSNIVHSI